MPMQATMTRERYIAAVRDAALKVAVLEPEERARLASYKMVYGTGYGTGARGVTYFAAWNKGGKALAPAAVDPAEPLIEICAFAEESLVQLAGTTIHEMAHALAGPGVGHAKGWITACKRLGLRGMKAAGTTYQSAMFVPALRELLAAIPEPTDGRVISWNAGGIVPGSGNAMMTRTRPCSAGIGVRGGRSRGPGSGSRLRKFVCDCGVIVRASRDTLSAHCDLCGSAFNRA